MTSDAVSRNAAPAVPVSTHRLQLEPGFTLDDAAAQVDHLAALGVTHLYLSPLLQATEGSLHGYDVVDHARVSDDLGGEAGFDRLCAAARAAGLGVVVDVVPNHMTTPTPLWLNRPLWSVLREGRASAYAHWFDVDWDAHGGRILLPVLGAPLEEVLAAGELSRSEHDGEAVVRYYDQAFPLAPGSDESAPLADGLDRQHYRLECWRLGDSELNYRRFFDVTSLIAVRVEEPDVFDATHERLLTAARSGAIDGLRIDHPDGLADPEGYLERLADATGGAWVVVEKILEGQERLPETWHCAGTTGYDALLRVGGLFVDPDGEGQLTALSNELLGHGQDLGAIIQESKRWVVETILDAEVDRLLRLVARARPDLDLGVARSALGAMLVGMDRYRVYVRPGHPLHGTERAELQQAVARGAGVPGSAFAAHGPVVEAMVDLALGEGESADAAARDEFVVRFQQTCGPVMAKAIEDTAYYRFVRLTALNEVGGDPLRFGIGSQEFHDFAAGLLERWPASMTTLSTHDTKRSEDVRARLLVLSERPEAWAEWVRAARVLAEGFRSGELDALTEYFLWQALVGAWPLSDERLNAYALKAAREAKLHTRWTEPNASYEAAVARFVSGVIGSDAVRAHVESWLAATAAEMRATTLGQKLVQLTMPGVPDVYQGTDLVDLSLVDPDNRRLVDYPERRRRLSRLDAGGAPVDLADEKLLVTSTALRLRRDRPEAFVGTDATYAPVQATSDHVVAFCRGTRDGTQVVTLATRLARRLADAGGWEEATLVLPTGRWRDLLSGRLANGGTTAVADLLPPEGLPVALLARVDG